MSRVFPIGMKEGLELEFKQADSLRNRRLLARAVAAMLNAKGGDVWIGVAERDEEAVGLDPIPAASDEQRALHDALVDLIDPSPTDDEVSVVVETFGEQSVLRVAVQPRHDRRPYAVVSGDKWSFPIRVGARVRPMSRHEVLGGSDSDSPEMAAEQRVLDDREDLVGQGCTGLFINIEPTVNLSIDLQDDSVVTLLEPERSGNRPSGWSFAQRGLGRGQLSKDERRWADNRLSGFYVAVAERGTLLFGTPLESLVWKGGPDVIWPIAFIEFVVSAFRITRAALGPRLPSSASVVTDLLLLGIGGWKLLPVVRYWQADDMKESPEDDLLWQKPLQFSSGELNDNPDACAFRWIRRVYQEYGLEEEEIRVFDPESLTLVLPDR